jgi:hypothetical protein
LHYSAIFIILHCKICASEDEMDGNKIIMASLAALVLGWICLALLSCDWTPERDNPLDPAADNYEPPTKGSISGVVQNLTGLSNLSGVTVTLPPGGRSQMTGGDGAYDFEGVSNGSHWINIRKDGYAPDSAQVVVMTGEIAARNFRMNELPVFNSVNVSSQVEAHFPGPPTVTVTVYANIIDRDSDSLSVMVLFDGDTLATYDKWPIGSFTQTYGSSYFPTGISELEGLPFVLVAEDTAGGVSVSEPRYVFRYLDVPILTSPISGSTVGTTPTLVWNFSNVGFPYYQNVRVYQTGGPLEWDSLTIASGVTQVTVTSPLEPTGGGGPESYSWTTEIVDQFGNTSISATGLFFVQE